MGREYIRKAERSKSKKAGTERGKKYTSREVTSK
jgi:hypothetical protein